jgi:hypothetical protein
MEFKCVLVFIFIIYFHKFLLLSLIFIEIFLPYILFIFIYLHYNDLIKFKFIMDKILKIKNEVISEGRITALSSTLVLSN